jgi:hypothetical protein
MKQILTDKEGIHEFVMQNFKEDICLNDAQLASMSESALVGISKNAPD